MRVLVLSLLLAGCHQTGKPSPVEPLESEAPPPVAVEAPKPALKVDATSAPGVIARRELEEVLVGSPGSFLQHVDSEPRFRGGKFAGWKLVAFFPGDTRFAHVDLHAGDVVTRVNGSTIEKPEQLMEVWQILRSSKELVVEVERDGAPRTLRWTIAP